MKKVLACIIILLGVMFSANAQDISKNAIGVRFGDNDGFGGEVSYQRHLKANNRLEADLGWRNSNNFDAFKLTGLYQWVFNIDKGFNWYVGAGGGVGAYDSLDNSGSFLFAAGDIGIEYNFEIPLLLSLDFRPELGFNSGISDDLGFDIALGIRYQF